MLGSSQDYVEDHHFYPCCASSHDYTYCQTFCLQHYCCIFVNVSLGAGFPTHGLLEKVPPGGRLADMKHWLVENLTTQVPLLA
jgi:hypothetical protein